MLIVPSPANPQVATATAVISATGGVQVRTGGGVLGPVLVSEAGSADAVAAFYDGTSTSGQLIATASLGIAGPVAVPNYAFAAGLFINVTGTSAGTLRVSFSDGGTR